MTSQSDASGIDISITRTVDKIQTILRPVLQASTASVEYDEDVWLIEGGPDSLIEPLAALVAESPDNRVRLQWVDESNNESETPKQRTDQKGRDKATQTEERAATESTEPKHTIEPGGQIVDDILTSLSALEPRIALQIEDVGDELPNPAWLSNSALSTVEATFTPYFERTGVWTLVDVSIETVSEFEQDILISVGLDPETGDRLPLLEELGEQLTGANDINIPDVSVDRRREQDIEPAPLETQIEPIIEKKLTATIDSIRQQAANAASVEFEDYVEVQNSRIASLGTDIAELQEELTAIGQRLDQADSREERLEALEQRDAKQDKLETKQTELSELKEASREGFPSYQSKIRNRHSVSVETEIVAMIEATYPKGDLMLTVTDGTREVSTRVAYGHRAAIFEQPSCEGCGSALTESNPGHIMRNQLLGANCCPE